jgi:hypothetical protein
MLFPKKPGSSISSSSAKESPINGVESPSIAYT